MYILHLYDKSKLQAIIKPTLLTDAPYLGIKKWGSTWRTNAKWLTCCIQKLDRNFLKWRYVN